MKDYLLDDKKGASKYIREAREDGKGNLSIEFGDGSVFRNIEACPENIQKIVEVQEAQAKNGIKNMSSYINREKSSKVRTILSGLGSVAGSTLLSVIASSCLQQPMNPLIVTAGIGAITILGTIPAYYRLRKDHAKVEELSKLRYRNEHLSELRSYAKYPNALAGIRPRLSSWMKKQEDPFSILSIDEFSEEDLRKIVSNMDVEEAYQFHYQEESKGKAK